MLIGSANLTRAALIDNVEASVLVDDKNTTSNALMFFNYLWDKENSSTITIDEVNSLQDKVNERKAFKNKPATNKASQSDFDKNKTLFEYVKSWVDIPKYDSKGFTRLWRGWYVIPDHGCISDRFIQNLKSYLPFIDGDIHYSDEKYNDLLDLFFKNSNFKRKVIKTPIPQLFVKSAKNYLLKFGWCYHPIKNNGKQDKKTLCLTDLGRQINDCNDLQCVNILYTNYFFHIFSYNNLAIVPFTQKILQRLEYLTLYEFNLFVVHAYSDDDLDAIIDFIEIYRSLSNSNKFHQDFRDYFNKIKESTKKDVYMNYKKSVKHTVSVIGWCNGFSLSDDFVLKLDNAE